LYTHDSFVRHGGQGLEFVGAGFELIRGKSRGVAGRLEDGFQPDRRLFALGEFSERLLPKTHEGAHRKKTRRRRRDFLE